MEQDNFNAMQNVQSFDWNNERLQQLKNLMPDLFTNDGQLNINELKKVINPNLITETERYEFTWFGKSNAKREAFTPTNATLVYDEDRSINPTKSENLIIEGENLAVLKLLSNSYREQIKCIYIDPPYNTGKDFVYSDKFNQDKKEYWEDAEITENGIKVDTNSEADGRFHSNWLNMMYSRLLISRQLLKEDGVIFISIDDNEVHHLRKLCDEVFGEENFVSEISWRKSDNQANIGQMARVKEYIILYSKNKEYLNLNKIPLTDKAKKEYSYKDEMGNFRRAILLHKTRGRHFYNVKTKSGSILNGPWMVKEDSFKEMDAKNQIYWTSGGDEQPYGKIYLHTSDGQIANDFWDTSYGSNQEASLGLEKLLESRVFDFPKSVKLLGNIYRIGTDKDDIILDFFAGSGTTAQAVMELNQEDGGNRKFILVQIPETTDEKSEAYKAGYKKISDITIERNKRVIDKIQKEQAETLKKQKQELQFEPQNQTLSTDNLGFKVFKLQKSNFPRVDFAPNPDASEEENIEALKKYIRDKESQMVNSYNREEIITEILIKNGFKLNYTLTPQTQFTKNEISLATDGEKETLICIDTSLHETTVEHFKTNTQQKLIVLERALNTTQKWNLKHHLNDKFIAF
jgi:adenine-specific DNA-methyltransferase